MKMTRALRTARRWLGWIHYTDRVNYWRRQARQNADAEQTMRTLREIAEAEQAEALAALLAAAANGVELGHALEQARERLSIAEQQNRSLRADLEAALTRAEQAELTSSLLREAVENAHEAADGQAELIEQLNSQLGVRGHLAGLTPAARRAAMEAVDPTNEWGWRE